MRVHLHSLLDVPHVEAVNWQLRDILLELRSAVSTNTTSQQESALSSFTKTDLPESLCYSYKWWQAIAPLRVSLRGCGNLLQPGNLRRIWAHEISV